MIPLSPSGWSGHKRVHRRDLARSTFILQDAWSLAGNSHSYRHPISHWFRFTWSSHCGLCAPLRLVLSWGTLLNNFLVEHESDILIEDHRPRTINLQYISHFYRSRSLLDLLRSRFDIWAGGVAHINPRLSCTMRLRILLLRSASEIKTVPR